MHGSRPSNYFLNMYVRVWMDVCIHVSSTVLSYDVPTQASMSTGFCILVYVEINAIDVKEQENHYCIKCNVVTCFSKFKQGLSIERVKKLHIDFTDNQKYL